MTEAGERLLRGARQALAFAQGKAKPGTFKVHYPPEREEEGDAQADARSAGPVNSRVRGNESAQRNESEHTALTVE